MAVNLNFEVYAHGSSRLHRWEPRCKLVALGTLILAFALVQDWRLWPVMGLIVGTFYRLSELPLAFWRQRLRYPSLFLLGMVAVLPFWVGTTICWQWGPLVVRSEGLLAAGILTVRFLAIVTLAMVLLGTTPFVTLARSLRGLGLSDLLVDLLLLTYRYLFDTVATLQTMQTAMRLRGFRPLGRWQWGQWGKPLDQLAALAGSLLIRSYEQSERVYRAMRLRGHGSAIATQPLPPPDRGSVGATVLCGGLALGLALTEWLL